MEIDTSTWMMIFFIIFLVISIWKIWAFLPNKELKDDDTTEASQKELLNMILSTIKKSTPDITTSELLKLIKEDEGFDKKHFWRFNENRLIQLLRAYYTQYPDTSSLSDIHKKLNS
ncbi:MAG: hypothetical protein U9O86_04600 [Campylobacterota bacterium]|nr:hypothetical protein [Campylobacterota bacterium]